MTEFFIGVDGGGTGCRAVVAGSDGAILGSGRSGSANIVTDPQTALINVIAAIDNAFEDAGLDKVHYATSHAVLGLAGGNVEGAGLPIERGLPFAHSDVEFDGVIALQGALGDRIQSVGGWGFPLGDLGSGARLGQSLLQESLLVHDGIHRRTRLTTDLLDEFDNNPDNLVEFAWTAKPGDFGKYAPRVFQYASEGDETARMLLERSAGYISETLDMLINQGAERISLLGGMAPLYVEWLPPHQQKLLVKPAADALTGALQLALKRYGPQNGKARE